MTIQQSNVVSNLPQPITIGQVTLIAGVGVQAGIVGHNPSPVVMCTHRNAIGTMGHLDYVFAAGTLTITSDNAADVSIVSFYVMGG